ncbi:MAG TPA: glycosyltransferase [Arcobacter sp.]|nr:glycosyltransferase [Arcobacter sp.]
MRKYEIMGATCFQVETIDSSKSYIKSLIANNQGGYSTAINAEKIMMYSKDTQLKEIIDNSVLPVPDGSGAVLGFKFLYGLNCIRLDLPRTIFELANEEKYKLFILGSSEEINIKAVEKLKEKYPNIDIVGRKNGYFETEEEIINLIELTKPQIVMVALGSPKQEKFAAKINKTLPNILFIGCGGALDILAGKITRAPKFFQDNHIEWLYRLILEPKRIKRQKILPIYLFKLIIETIKRKIK